MLVSGDMEGSKAEKKCDCSSTETYWYYARKSTAEL
jgi:hypothetical protein